MGCFEDAMSFIDKAIRKKSNIQGENIIMKKPTKKLEVWRVSYEIIPKPSSGSFNPIILCEEYPQAELLLRTTTLRQLKTLGINATLDNCISISNASCIAVIDVATEGAIKKISKMDMLEV